VTQFRAEWDEVIALSHQWIEAGEVERLALKIVREHVANLQSSLRKPYLTWIDEAYYIVELHQVLDAEGSLCLPQIRSAAGSRQRKATDQMKQMDRAREIHGEFGNQKDVVSSCRANRIGADQKVGIGRGLARLGCASLVGKRPTNPAVHERQ
jgi:hypothetical protein